jgi:hypothetical protein
VRAGKGEDSVDAGDGDDRISARDHQADDIDCGAGEDTVKADANDELTGCEDAKVRKGKGPSGERPAGTPARPDGKAPNAQGPKPKD